MSLGVMVISSGKVVHVTQTKAIRSRVNIKWSCFHCHPPRYSSSTLLNIINIIYVCKSSLLKCWTTKTGILQSGSPFPPPFCETGHTCWPNRDMTKICWNYLKTSLVQNANHNPFLPQGFIPGYRILWPQHTIILLPAWWDSNKTAI